MATSSSQHQFTKQPGAVIYHSDKARCRFWTGSYLSAEHYSLCPRLFSPFVFLSMAPPFLSCRFPTTFAGNADKYDLQPSPGQLQLQCMSLFSSSENPSKGSESENQLSLEPAAHHRPVATIRRIPGGRHRMSAATNYSGESVSVNRVNGTVPRPFRDCWTFPMLRRVATTHRGPTTSTTLATGPVRASRHAPSRKALAAGPIHLSADTSLDPSELLKKLTSSTRPRLPV